VYVFKELQCIYSDADQQRRACSLASHDFVGCGAWHHRCVFLLAASVFCVRVPWVSQWTDNLLFVATTDHLSRSACRLLGPIPYPHGGGYNAAVAIGYYLLLPPEAMKPDSYLQVYAKRHRLHMDAYRVKIASTTNGEVHAKHYALASLYYVLDAIFRLFDGDERAVYMMRNSRAVAYSKRLDEFWHSDSLLLFVDTMFVLLQNLVQDYNTMVHKQNQKLDYFNQLTKPVLHGIFQIIRAPRPWILLQLLQMRCQFDRHNTITSDRGVQVIFTDLLPVALPQRGASAWLRAVEECNVLCIEAPDNFCNAAPGNSESDVHLVLGMLVATVGNDTSIYSETLNAFIFEGMHILSRWRA